MKFKGIFIALGIMATAFICLHAVQHKSDAYFRERTVSITGEKGLCSGEQVHAPSGQDYILTAAHCHLLASADGMMTVTDEKGVSIQRKVIAEDDTSDLLLLEGLPHLRGLDIAPSVHRFEHIRTFTHGARMPTYKTEGSVVMTGNVSDSYTVEFEMPLDAAHCVGAKYKQDHGMGFFGPEDVCLMSMQEEVISASIVPGSSGGMVVNDSGELVGVVSAGNPNMTLFGFVVSSLDIRSFLKGY